MALPRFIVLQSVYNNKYLQYVHEEGEIHSFLQFSGDEVVSRYARFEVEMARSEQGLVHLKCCYNNKYLVRWSPNHWWIVGAADCPEENQSKWSCTLFKPSFVNGDDKKIQFLHVQLGHYACLGRTEAPYTSCLFVGSQSIDEDSRDVYTIIDWNTVSIAPMPMPRFIVLKSNYNNKLLRYINESEIDQFLQFSGDNVMCPYARFEVEMAKNVKGLVHLKCCHNNKYLVRWSPNHWWIVGAADRPEEDQSKWSCTLFKPSSVHDDVKKIRLLHVQLGHYACLWRAAAPYTSCLFGGSQFQDRDGCEVYTVIDWESLYLMPNPMPRFIVLKSNYNNKFLRYISHGEIQHFLQFSGDEAKSSYAKFGVEMAKDVKGLVHLRCCFNNKYLVRWSPSHRWIVGGADRPEEDQSKWSCTLFKPISVDGDAQKIRLLHVQLSHYACLWRAAAPYTSCLFGGSPSHDRDSCDVYTVIDWESLFIMPKPAPMPTRAPLPMPTPTPTPAPSPMPMSIPRFIVLTSNYNYKILQYINEGQIRHFLQFSGDQIRSPYAQFELEMAKNEQGLVHLKCCFNNKYLVRLTPNHLWIAAKADKPEEDQSEWSCTLFKPIFVDGDSKKIRLLHVQLGRYACWWKCTKSLYDGCLSAFFQTPDEELRDVFTIVS